MCCVFDDRHFATFGSQVPKKRLVVAGVDTSLLIHDVDDAFASRALPLSQLRGAAACILVADGTRPRTVSSIRALQSRLRIEVGDLPTVVALNKSDLVGHWDQAAQDLIALQQPGGPVMKTSARTGKHIGPLFASVARRVLMREALFR